MSLWGHFVYDKLFCYICVSEKLTFHSFLLTEQHSLIFRLLPLAVLGGRRSAVLCRFSGRQGWSHFCDSVNESCSESLTCGLQPVISRSSKAALPPRLLSTMWQCSVFPLFPVFTAADIRHKHGPNPSFCSSKGFFLEQSSHPAASCSLVL